MEELGHVVVLENANDTIFYSMLFNRGAQVMSVKCSEKCHWWWCLLCCSIEKSCVLLFWKMPMIWMLLLEPLPFHKEGRKHDTPPEIVESLCWFVKCLINLKEQLDLGIYFSHRIKRKCKDRSSPGSDIRLIQKYTQYPTDLPCVWWLPNLQLLS